MRVDFVEYLKNKGLYPTSIFEKNMCSAPHCPVRIIENLSGLKINAFPDLNSKTKAKIIYILERHLNMSREKASNGSQQYNTNRHIGLLQALAELRTKKTQPDEGCVISKL